jgi:glycosyltransferase involved in cell wall biosynthesis
MKYKFDNVNLSSTSGPNSFAAKLRAYFDAYKHEYSNDPDVVLTFIQQTVQKYDVPNALRLDGIYFNSAQDFALLNEPIKYSYDAADMVIYQSEFNKRLTEAYFGVKEKTVVINNGTLIDLIKSQPPLDISSFGEYENIWSCAASWRPHKRLSDNIRYFQAYSPDNTCFVVAGANAPDYLDLDLDLTDVMFIGALPWHSLVKLYRASSTFVHLAWLDHCPNVVVDARAAGCHIVCSSSGGTKEIAGQNSTLIGEEEWDLRPTALYSPPKMDYSNQISNEHISNIDIRLVGKRYENALMDLL